MSIKTFLFICCAAVMVSTANAENPVKPETPETPNIRNYRTDMIWERSQRVYPHMRYISPHR